MGAHGAHGAGLAGRSHHLALSRHAPAIAAGDRADHGQGSGTPSVHAGKSGPARHRLHHQLALLRASGDQARRDRSRAPALAECAALHHRGRRRLLHGRGRARPDASRRFRSHAGLDLARPRSSWLGAGDLAGRARQSLRPVLRRDLSRELSGRDPSGVAGRGRRRCALRFQPDAGRIPAAAPRVPAFGLSVRPYPRGTRPRGAQRPAASRARREDALRQPERRRLCLPHAGRVHSMDAEGILRPDLSQHRRCRVQRGRGAWSGAHRERRFCFRAARCLRGAAVDALLHRDRERMRPVQLFRPRCAGGARLLA